MMRKFLLWFFVDRRTGVVTIAQMPNLLLWIVIAAGGAQWLWRPPSYLGTALAIVFQVGLVVWALDEILRGINPWRRSLGCAVLLYELATIVLSVR